MSLAPAPIHFVVRLSDDALFNCPFLMASDPGTVGFNDVEVERLREYLLKGGFLWVDDFWGTPAWTQWSTEIARVLPEFPIEDVSATDPIMHAQFEMTQVPQISNFQFWRRTGGRDTSERGPDSDVVHFRVLCGRAAIIPILIDAVGIDNNKSMPLREFVKVYQSAHPPSGRATAMQNE